MIQHALIAPMMAMVFLIFLVMTAMLLSRIHYVRQGKVRMSYFRTMTMSTTGTGAATGHLEVPVLMQQMSRNYTNLFEYPVLFYAACLVIMVTGNDDPMQLTLAWTFVGARYAHSLIHTTYNDVRHRLVAFFISVFAVLTMWVRLFPGF